MNRPLIRTLLFALVAGVILLALQWHFAHAWTSYYSQFPWPGYQQAMREGHVPAFLTSSSRSSLVGSIVIFSLPILTFWFAGGRLIRSTLALWAGVMISLITTWIATPQLRADGNMWPIDLMFLAFTTGIPLLLGAVVFVMIQKSHRFLLDLATKRPQSSG
jgi:hypothetical protein